MEDYIQDQMRHANTVHGVNPYRKTPYEEFTLDEAINWVGGVKPTISGDFFNLLKKQGLEKHMRFLDFGCGCLRISVPLIEYLDEGKYHGLEGDPALLKVATEVSLPKHLNETKHPKFAQSWDFEFEKFGEEKFDVIASQGVICHMAEKEIRRLFHAVNKHLSDDGFAIITYAPGRRTDKNPFRWEQSDLESFLKETKLQIKHLGEWGHPRDHHAFRLTKGK